MGEIIVSKSIENPYVGPRSFSEQDAHLFFGRERESAELLSLVVSHRVVIFNAQSGAGKSSLINARLKPQLELEGFTVLPVGRVSGTLPDGITDDEVDNIFVFNLLLSLGTEEQDATQLVQSSLRGYLQTNQSGEISARVLIIDQFEEIFTAHLDRWKDRKIFFEQLGQVVRDVPLLWVVLTMREDFVAGLDTFAPLIPGNLRVRYYMQRLRASMDGKTVTRAAMQVIEEPARIGGRPFDKGVAEILIKNLSQSGELTHVSVQAGEYLEPLQLQVVCQQLWEAVQTEPGETISAEQVNRLDVDTALAQFYAQALQHVVENSQGTITQLDLRSWIERNLITESQKRGTVSQGSEITDGLANEHVQNLQNHFLLRSVRRAGSTWYELVHDRFVDPILQSNQAWRIQQGEVLLAAERWQEKEKNDKFLYKGLQLFNALRVYKKEDLEPLVREFLDASKLARRKRSRRRFLSAGLVFAVLVILLVRWISTLEPFSTSVAFTPDGSTLIVTTSMNSINFYDLSDLDNPTQRGDHASNTAAYAAIVSPDGEMLATGSSDNTIRLWDLTDPERPSKILGEDGGSTITHLAFSPDGQSLASVDIIDASTVKLWTVNEPNRPPQELRTGNLDDLVSIEFSPGGQQLVAVDKEERVYLWQLSNLDRGPRFLIDADN
jgi:hypothetical protein